VPEVAGAGDIDSGVVLHAASALSTVKNGRNRGAQGVITVG
jgi:hypothetical protein